MLTPLFALFERSLREQARLRSTYVVRTAIGLLLLLIIALNERDFVRGAAPGQSVLIVLVWVNALSIFLLGLATFPSAITEEKEQRTLGLMLMTQLNPLAILLGKSTARLFNVLLLLAVQLPFTMLCTALGGVSPWQILRCYAILASLLFLFCNVSLLWSVLCRRSGDAGGMTIFTGAFLYLGPFFFMTAIVSPPFSGQASATTWSESIGMWVISINPALDLVKTISPLSGIPFPVNSIGFSLIGGVISFGLAWLLFDSFCSYTDDAATAAIRTPKRSGPGPRRRFAVPRPGRFPLAWHSFHYPGNGYAGVAIRFLLNSGFLAFILWKIDGRISAGHFGGVMMGLGILAFTAELYVASWRVFGMERKQKTLGSLCLLPIETTSLVWQKILGALPRLIPSAVTGLAGLAIAIIGSHAHAWNRMSAAGAMLISLLVVTEYFFFTVLILYLSLRLRGTDGLTLGVGATFVGNSFLGGLTGGFSNPAGVVLICAMFPCLTAAVATLIPRALERAVAQE